MNKTVSAIFCPLFLILSINSRAEFPNHPLPDLGNLAIYIVMADKSKVEEGVYDANGRISANLHTPDSFRGRTAGAIAGLLSGDSEKLRIKMYKALLGQRDLFEKNLTENNYVLEDMGVAYAVNFVMLWELASNRVLSPSTSNMAAKYLVHAFRKMEQTFVTISDDEKAKAYDWLITTPVVIASLVSVFEKEGRAKEVEMLREKSASLFLNAFQVPHDMMTIRENGEVYVDVKKVVAYQ